MMHKQSFYTHRTSVFFAGVLLLFMGILTFHFMSLTSEVMAQSTGKQCGQGCDTSSIAVNKGCATGLRCRAVIGGRKIGVCVQVQPGGALCPTNNACCVNPTSPTSVPPVTGTNPPDSDINPGTSPVVQPTLQPGNPIAQECLACDVNGDGLVNPADSDILQKKADAGSKEAADLLASCNNNACFNDVVISVTPPSNSQGGDCSGPQGVPDGKVNLYDFERLRTEFGSTREPLTCDFDTNGTVNLLDFETLRQNFGN